MVSHPKLSKYYPSNSTKRTSRNSKVQVMLLCRCGLSYSCKPIRQLSKDSHELSSNPLGSSIINLDNVVDSRANDLIRSVVERHRSHLISTLQVVNESLSSRVPNFNRTVIRCWYNKRISSSRSMNSIDDSLVSWEEYISKLFINPDLDLYQS